MISKKIYYNDDDYYLQIWDTAIEPNNNKIYDVFFEGAKGAFLIYDITNLQSFININNYNQQINENITEPFKILIGYNCDKENRAVTPEEGKNLANELKIDSFFEIPSQGNEKIDEMINILSVKRLFDEKNNNCLII